MTLPEPRVLAWADDLNPEDVAITAMNEAEILHGLAHLPDGRRKKQLRQSWEALAAELFAGRIWPFTSEAVHWSGELLRQRERLAHGVPLATRNVADFAEIGLTLINPWDLPCKARRLWVQAPGPSGVFSDPEGLSAGS